MIARLVCVKGEMVYQLQISHMVGCDRDFVTAEAMPADRAVYYGD